MSFVAQRISVAAHIIPRADNYFPEQREGRQTDRQTDIIVDTPTVGASSALPTMGHENQLCLPTRAPAQPTYPPNQPLHRKQRCAGKCNRAARLALYSAFALVSRIYTYYLRIILRAGALSGRNWF